MLSMGVASSLVEDCQLLLEVHVMTDGNWVWPNEIAHYVRAHRLMLPEEFLQQIADADFEPPSLSDAQLESIDLECQQLWEV